MAAGRMLVKSTTTLGISFLKALFWRAKASVAEYINDPAYIVPVQWSVLWSGSCVRTALQFRLSYGNGIFPFNRSCEMDCHVVNTSRDVSGPWGPPCSRMVHKGRMEKFIESMGQRRRVHRLPSTQRDMGCTIFASYSSDPSIEKIAGLCRGSAVVYGCREPSSYKFKTFIGRRRFSWWTSTLIPCWKLMLMCIDPKVASSPARDVESRPNRPHYLGAVVTQKGKGIGTKAIKC